MKLPLLLAQFLYEHKTLSLPGIGIFTLDPSVIIPDEKNNKETQFIPTVEFKNAAVKEADEELIEFIKRNTGKIRPLAISDLDSYLTLGQQMLNIGKPFYIEGVGTLLKGKDGKFDFVSGQHDVAGIQNNEINKENQSPKKQSLYEETAHPYQSQNNTGRKVIIALAFIAGLAILVWGAYKLYQKNITPETNTVSTPLTNNNDTSAVKIDSQKVSAPPIDSSQLKKPVTKQITKPNKDSLQYKFVILSTNNKDKALKRYNQLLSYLLKIKMQTRDSSSFKLYFTFPASPKDTVHIKDSLNMVYATHTIIELAMNN